MISLDTAEKALKSLYLGVVSDQINLGTNPFVAQIEQTTSDVYGKEVIKAVSYGLNGGIGAGAETGDLPVPAGNNYTQMRAELKNLFGTIEISDKAIKASENTAGAFVNLLNAEMEGLLKASKFNFGRMIFGDGSGVLGKSFMATPGSNRDKIFVVGGVRNFAEGMVVTIYAPNGDVVIPAVRITRVVQTPLAGAGLPYIQVEHGSELVGDYYCITMQNSHNLEITGLEAIFGDAPTLYGLLKSEHTWLNPIVNDVDNTDAFLPFVQRAMDDMEASCGSSADIIISSYGVRRTAVEHLSMYRMNTDYMTLKGGFKALSYNGVPWVAERFVQPKSAYILNSADFKLHQLCDWRWLEGDNGKILRQISGKAAYTATLVKYAELLCARPWAQSKLINITEM